MVRFLSQRDTTPLRSKTLTPQILALGLPRCATSSLQMAFEQIGLAPCMHMAEVAPFPHRLDLVLAAMRLMLGERFETHRAERHAILRQLFDGWASSSDFPAMLFPEDMLDLYPDAKVVLNKRATAQAWCTSINRTLRFFETTKYRIVCALWYTDRAMATTMDVANQVARERMGVENLWVVDAFDAHNERVRKAAKERGREVLEWVPSDGWEPVCKLLGKEVPKEQFPHANDEAEITKLKIILMTRGALSWLALIGLPLLAFRFIASKPAWLASITPSSLS